MFSNLSQEHKEQTPKSSAGRSELSQRKEDIAPHPNNSPLHMEKPTGSHLREHSPDAIWSPSLCDSDLGSYGP